jgi:myo-inositol catabolism protein IolC
LASVCDIETLAECMKTNGHDVSVHVIPGASHLFQKKQFARSVVHSLHALGNTPELWGGDPMMRRHGNDPRPVAA